MKRENCPIAGISHVEGSTACFAETLAHLPEDAQTLPRHTQGLSAHLACCAAAVLRVALSWDAFPLPVLPQEKAQLLQIEP